MAAPMLLRADLAALDRDIAAALVSLRLARATAERRPGPRSTDSATRAESALNALLETRLAVQRPVPFRR